MNKYTKEDIAYFKRKLKEDPDALTPNQKRIANLKPPEKGEVRNPTGKGAGNPSWSKKIQRLMDDPDFLKTIISNLPSQWQGIVNETSGDVIAAGIITAVTKSVAEAISNNERIDKDTKDSIALLNRMGYGDKADISFSDGIFDKMQITFNTVNPRDES